MTQTLRKIFEEELHKKTPKVYCASKLEKAVFWKDLRKSRSEVDIISRWIDYVGILDDSSEHARLFWQKDLQDIFEADYLIVYATKDEHLRGALVEVGAALVLNKTVIAIGAHPDYGTWQYHPKVVRVAHIYEAIDYIVKTWACPT